MQKKGKYRASGFIVAGVALFIICYGFIIAFRVLPEPHIASIDNLIYSPEGNMHLKIRFESNIGVLSAWSEVQTYTHIDNVPNYYVENNVNFTFWMQEVDGNYVARPGICEWKSAEFPQLEFIENTKKMEWSGTLCFPEGGVYTYHLYIEDINDTVTFIMGNGSSSEDTIAVLDRTATYQLFTNNAIIGLAIIVIGLSVPTFWTTCAKLIKKSEAKKEE